MAFQILSIKISILTYTFHTLAFKIFVSKNLPFQILTHHTLTFEAGPNIWHITHSLLMSEYKMFAKFSSSWLVKPSLVELRLALILFIIPTHPWSLVWKLYLTKLGQLAN